MRTSCKSGLVAAAAAATAVAIAAGSAAGDNASLPPAAPRVWTTLGAFRTPPTARLLPRRLLTSFAAPVFIVPVGVPAGQLGGYRFFLVPGRARHVCLMGLRGHGK